jgi:hypothetical protein
MNAELRQTIEISKRKYESSLTEKQLKLKQALENAQKNTKQAREAFLKSLDESQKQAKELYEEALKTFQNAKEAAQKVIKNFNSKIG